MKTIFEGLGFVAVVGFFVLVYAYLAQLGLNEITRIFRLHLGF